MVASGCWNRIKFELESFCRVYSNGIEPFDAGDVHLIRKRYKDGEISIESLPMNIVILEKSCQSRVDVTFGRKDKLLAIVRIFSNGEIVINYEWSFNLPQHPNQLYQIVPYFENDGSRPPIKKSEALHLELDTKQNHE